MGCNEFSLIARYFNRINKTPRLDDIETGIGDDCALLNVPDKKTLAISTDTLVCGQHFLQDINPVDLAYKALAVNISDLAAMGACPAWLILALTLPEINETWLKSFSDSLFEQLNYYNMQLIGGNTSRGPLSITLTIHGYVPKGKSLKRVGAKPGDCIYVTGTLGDSAAGLAILQNHLTVADKNDEAFLIKRHLRPVPRVLYGQALLDCASSAIDLSDGLIYDLGHILKRSKVGAQIDLNLFPLSDQIQRYVELEQALRWALSGGEDYELCFTVPKSRRAKLDAALAHFEEKFTCIGEITPINEGLKFMRGSVPVKLNWKGYDHFM